MLTRKLAQSFTSLIMKLWEKVTWFTDGIIWLIKICLMTFWEKLTCFTCGIIWLIKICLMTFWEKLTCFTCGIIWLIKICLMTLWEKLTCFTCGIIWLIKICLMTLWEKVNYITCGIICLILSFVLLQIFNNYCPEKQNQFDRHHMRMQTARRHSRWLPQSCKTITDCKEFVCDSTSCPEFIQELLPSAERTALLYHLSYLCLGNFPELERVIREGALETQLLFGSSEALLLKYAKTSENIVKLLLPNLEVAAVKNKPELALKHLEKAKGWISDIIMDGKEIVKRYEKHNSDVCNMTSDIITKMEKTEKKQHQTSEMKKLLKIIDGLKEKHLSISEQIEDYERKIEEKNTEMRELISRIRETDFNMYSMIVPFVDSIISHIYKTIESTSEKDQLRTLHADLSETIEAQKRLKEEEWGIQVKLMENELKLAKLLFENGQLSRVRSLDEVRKRLSRIQQILIQLQKFWEKVGSKLDTLKESTFAGDVWIKDLTDMKEEFLESIYAAEEGWIKFGISCMKANNIFSIQANEAYRFLEISPSSLSEEEWQKEYESVKEKLQKKIRLSKQ